MNHKTYQQTLPRKRISAGCLLFDESGRLLIVNPVYKDGWEIPGGVVEANESPLEGCAREILEELGIAWRPQRLLSVDYSGETDRRTESLSFIFYGGILSPEHIATIRLPKRELSEYRFVEVEEALTLFKRRLRRRIACCLGLIGTNLTLYLEEQEPVLADR